MQRQMKIIISAVALANGLGGGTGGGVSAKGNSRGGEIGLHGIRQAIHPVFFGIAGDIEIALLSGRAEKNAGHDRLLSDGNSQCILCGMGANLFRFCGKF